MSGTIHIGMLSLVAACLAGAGVAAAADQTGGQGVPQSQSPPTVTGTTVVGDPLTEGHAMWSNGPTSYAYQWEDCDGYGENCSAIPDATGQSYTLAARDVGHTIRVRESAANAAGSSGFATSAATALVYAAGQQHQAPWSAAAPMVSGAPYVGGKVQSSPGAWASASRVSYAYQWQRCRASCHAIPGASRPWYTAAPTDRRARLRVVVTASNAFGRGQATSALTAAVGPPNAAIQRPLQHAVTPTGKGARLSAIRAARGYWVRFSAVVPGRLNVQWFYLPKGTHLGQVYGKVVPVLVASASTEIARARQVKLKVSVTPAGGALLSSKPLVKLTGKGSFSPPGRPSVVVIARFALSG